MRVDEPLDSSFGARPPLGKSVKLFGIHICTQNDNQKFYQADPIYN